MLLEKLTLTDFGAYSGLQEFNLAPRVRYGSKRPIILFGGLNGAGKTTFLTAVRLALYGRNAFDAGTTQKQYELNLRELIHRPKHSLVKPSKASVALELLHARFGDKTKYRIIRSWEVRGKDGANEKLIIFRNDEKTAFLVDEQAQSFITQLIPTGVAQFFFFDGEKIASLAQDDTDVVLADAVRRLLGLDLTERLDSDLSVYLRQLRANRVDAKTRDEIAELQAQLDRLEVELRESTAHLEQVLTPQLTQAKQILERKRMELSDRGGAWAVDRKALGEELDQLRGKRTELEHQLREQLSGIAIFSLAPKLCQRVINSLQRGQEQLERELLAKTIRNQLLVLKKRIKSLTDLKISPNALSECIDGWADELLVSPMEDQQHVDHGLVASEARAVIEGLTQQAQLAARDLHATYRFAETIAKQEDNIQERLATAPSDESLQDAVDALTKAAEQVAQLISERKAHIEELRRKTWISIDLVRKLKKLESRIAQENDVETGEQTAVALQAMIEEFKVAAAIEKCESLRKHFISAFLRLARKGDIVHDAKIDPRDFTVTLFDQSGREIPKKRLSAGEKQIYAIAMLEALSKTSGRNLPVIIDTPLGRLDSKHRTKLVESYFPVASHQVIILSTDTEVDSPFYEGLQKHISHAYRLSFDPEEGATKVESGYFWKQEQANVA
jgi:DNA sulfur modification protein DndD